ncbi:MAG: HAMP domain-containing histidine kinase [Clostridia bacterium]|nr:HAMP domain-containing histidine kinase [Clostridia bacterium]
MIRRLRRRMILLVLIGLLLASAGVVAAINWMNWNSLSNQAEAVLDMLAENGGQRPLSQKRGNREDMPSVKPEGTPPPDKGEDQPWLRDGAEFQDRTKNRNNTAMTNAANLSNYYTVTLDGDNRVISWQSDRADLYQDEEISQLAAAALQGGKNSGRIGTQFYRLVEEDGNERRRMLIVVDRRLEIQNAQSVLLFTALVALAEDALLSLAAVWLIHRLVKPVDETMEKQKQFVWDASHELKTPLAVISANAEALAGEIGVHKSLEYIQSEVKRTDSLIQNLLTLARMEKGTVQAAHQRFDLSRAMLEVALPFESAIFETGKELTMNIPDGITYEGDVDMIKQLIVILLSNAQKYSDDGGKIDVTLETKGERRVIKVHNTGPAIPREAQERIFDRFYRVDSSHNREIEGNGLGLAIARSIVEAHKGKISVHSAEGEGTTFTVIL